MELNKETKVLTPADIIAKAEKLKKRERKKAVFFIDELGGNIVVVEPTFDIVRDSSEMEKSESDTYLVSQCIAEPNLKDPSLMSSLGAFSPAEAVKVMFKEQTITHIAIKALSLGNFDGSGVKKVEEIKN